MKPLVNIGAAVGKTIERTVESGSYLAIHYTDGTASVVESGEDGIEHWNDIYYQACSVSHELGLCSKEEHEEFERKFAEAWARRATSNPVGTVIASHHTADSFESVIAPPDWPLP